MLELTIAAIVQGFAALDPTGRNLRKSASRLE